MESLKLLRASNLLDENHYRSAAGIERPASAFDLILHYLIQGKALGLQPNALFVPAYYATQLGCPIGTKNLLTHHAEKGWRLNQLAF